MTVIAWDGKTLAADKRTTSGSLIGVTTKIFRVYGCLVAVTGNMSVGMEMVDWFRNGASRDDYPASNRNLTEGANLIVIGNDGLAREYCSGPHAYLNEGKFLAWGSGAACAMVAMECGRSAAEAVEIAGHYDTSCGNGVDQLTFEKD